MRTADTTRYGACQGHAPRQTLAITGSAVGPLGVAQISVGGGINKTVCLLLYSLKRYAFRYALQNVMVGKIYPKALCSVKRYAFRYTRYNVMPNKTLGDVLCSVKF